MIEETKHIPHPEEKESLLVNTNPFEEIKEYKDVENVKKPRLNSSKSDLINVISHLILDYRKED